MNSIKYVLLTTVAIAVCGLIWLSKSTPVISKSTVQLQIEPPLEQIIADDTVVKFQLQALNTKEEPIADAKVRVRILTPSKTLWFTSDFSIVEGTELLNLEAITPQGNLEFEQVLPIRGNYTMEIAVNPNIAGSFEAFEQSLIISVPENPIKYRNLAILAVILLAVGLVCGWIIGNDRPVQDEIAPQPVRMLLSVMTIIAIAALLFVNGRAEVSASNVKIGEVPTAAVARNETIQIELLGDTQAVVGNLATQAVQVTEPSTDKPITDVMVRIESVALESDALMFAYQSTLDNAGQLIWQEQFFDGAPHSVTATVIPLENSSGEFTSLQVSQSIEVEGIAPPLLIRFISLFYLTLIFVVGLSLGFWRERRQIV
ncbi:MAG: hypothetical protein AAF298_11080 [Cyanobacteria bacterium P01_A01_bin.40]